MNSSQLHNRPDAERYFVLAATAVVQPFLESFKEFRPRQKAASFTLEQALQKMESVGSGAGH
jgi:arylsulfatase